MNAGDVRLNCIHVEDKNAVQRFCIVSKYFDDSFNNCRELFTLTSFRIHGLTVGRGGHDMRAKRLDALN